MKLRRADYLLAQLAHAGRPLGRLLGNVETEFLRGKLESTPVVQPLFLTGLARSGTTILLQELCRTDLFATHRYRDFPFLMTPYVWNRFLDRFTKEDVPIERPHNDRIQITRESPEAFEEPIWQYFFPHVHAREAVHRLSADVRNPRFERFFREHIQKILLLRGRPRYLSKGNYNLTRLEYLATLFPDAKFVIPVRHPFSHVASLVRQHQLFTEYARLDRQVPKYLASAGHYEFGPQRSPLRLSQQGGDRTAEAWRRGDEYAGYAIQWAEVYRLVDSLRNRKGGPGDRMLVVRYEDFCANPGGTLRSILGHSNIDEMHVPASRSLEHIAPPARDTLNLSEEIRATIWEEAADIAGYFGYEPDEWQPGDRHPFRPEQARPAPGVAVG